MTVEGVQLESEESPYPRQQFILDIIKAILLFVLCVIMIIALFYWDTNAYLCLESPVSYYEQMFNQSCLCRGVEEGAGYSLNLSIS